MVRDRWGRWLSRFLVAMTVSLLMAACGGDDEGTRTDAAGPSSDDRASNAPPLASAIRIDDTVDAQIGAGDFAAVEGAVDVTVGDIVRTDTSGFAEIDYFDGSLTRLDTETEFEIIALQEDPGGSEVRTRMGLGRTYHRVTELTGDDTYTVETAVATATVRGTAFIIRCSPDACIFYVLDGTVVVTPDATGQAVTVDAGEMLLVPDDPGATPSIEPVGLSPGVTADPWVGHNLDLDGEDGFDVLDVGELAAPTNPGSPTCVMNGSTGGGWAASFVDEPVGRAPWQSSGSEGFSFSNSAAAEDPGAITVNITPTAVFFSGPSGKVGTSVNDGGTYDFAADGSGARVVDERPAQLDTPEVSIDVTIECS